MRELFNFSLALLQAIWGSYLSERLLSYCVFLHEWRLSVQVDYVWLLGAEGHGRLTREGHRLLACREVTRSVVTGEELARVFTRLGTDEACARHSSVVEHPTSCGYFLELAGERVA